MVTTAVRTHHVTVEVAGSSPTAAVRCTCTWSVEVEKDKALRYAAAHLRETKP